VQERRRRLKRFTIMLLALCSVASSGCAEVSPQLQAIGMTFARGAGFSIPFMTGLIVLIFLMNKFITKHGRTNDQLCSIIGVITFPLIWFGVLYWRFGFSWIIIAVSAAAGGLTGWFSYMIDELLENYWEQRVITIPGTLGLLLNGVLVSTMFTAVWLEGEMYITQRACATRVIVERYTRHTSSDSKGHTHTTYTWDYYSHKDQMADGWDFPRLKEGKDYVLGTGCFGRKDQARNEYYQFIGGYFWSGKHHKWKDFQWLLLQHKVSFVTRRVQKV
jgi:hypothetical protein